MAVVTFPRWLFPVLIIALIGGVVGLNRLRAPVQPPLLVQCTDLHAGCVATLGGREIEVGARGEIKVLAPFEFWVRASGAKRVQASFAMKDMDMGFNLYTLRPGPDGAFSVRVTLPVCVSGRRDWYVVLDVDGQKLQVPFVTQL